MENLKKADLAQNTILEDRGRDIVLHVNDPIHEFFDFIPAVIADIFAVRFHPFRHGPYQYVLPFGFHCFLVSLGGRVQ